ncbi:MAG: TetR family transcriptional regulator [Bacteroidetes bacterium MedPE-SWsnd-G2]|nr:MAG: TetR family transcriptional regulator [Bacteroidetes bacterium MedPE-SWsnd-G2]
MSQRKKSQLKRIALVSATISLVNDDGFHAASMSKIAKLAGVVPGTIYLYFQNKQDLINQVYLDVKKEFTTFAFENYTSSNSVQDDFELIWKRIAQFKLTHLDKALFLHQCDITPMLDEESRQEGIKHLQPLLNLWIKGQQEGLIKPLSPFLLYAYSIFPLSFLTHSKKRGVCEISEEDLEQTYQAAWDSIKL